MALMRMNKISLVSMIIQKVRTQIFSLNSQLPEDGSSKKHASDLAYFLPGCLCCCGVASDMFNVTFVSKFTLLTKNKG